MMHYTKLVELSRQPNFAEMRTKKGAKHMHIYNKPVPLHIAF